ncbi:MAG: hypothetical protein Q8R36_01370 [bacterium]|nr:hypothetical protein [bacterium]
MNARGMVSDYTDKLKSMALWEWRKTVFFGFGAFGVTWFALFASKIVPPQLDILQFPSWYENFSGVAIFVVIALLLLNKYFENFIFRNAVTCTFLFIFLALCVFLSMFPKTGLQISVLEFFWGVWIVCMASALYFRASHKSSTEQGAKSPQTA